MIRPFDQEALDDFAFWANDHANPDGSTHWLDGYQDGAAVAFAIIGMFTAIAEREREKAIEARTRWGLADSHMHGWCGMVDCARCRP